MKAYKLLPSLIDEATLNVSKLCEHNLECVLISKNTTFNVFKLLEGNFSRHHHQLQYIRNWSAADYEAVRK